MSSFCPSKENTQCFKNIVNRVLLRDFNYELKPFTFKTVFHLAPYSYRCCPCSYEFEYLEFISDCGEINESMLNNLLQSLTNQQCPHVDSVNREFVNRTECRGFHIVAALEDTTALKYFRDKRYMSDINYGPSGLFEITPCHMAVLKGKPISLYFMLDLYSWVSYSGDWIFKYWYRSEEDKNRIVFEESTFLEQCVRKDNIPLLISFIRWDVKRGQVGMDISKALKFTFLHEKIVLQNILMRNMKKFGGMDSPRHFGYIDVIGCAVMAIIFNKPGVLKRVLSALSYLFCIDQCEPDVPDLCVRLPRPECQNVIQSFGICCKTSEPIEDTVRGLNGTLVQYLGCYDEEIVTFLKSVPEVEAIINGKDDKGQTILEKYLKPKFSPDIKYLDQSPNPKIVGLLFDLGANINQPLSNGETPLKFLIREWVTVDGNLEQYVHKNVRQTVELLLRENPSFEVQNQDHGESDPITRFALELDMYFLRKFYGSLQPFYFLEYHPKPMIEMNNSVNTESHHTDERYALNFLLPFLIECGYPANRNDLLKKADPEYIEPEEYEYIQHVLHRPRGLALMCRDSLRRHFKGRAIAYYLDMAKAPKRVKDFVLLKQELLMLYGQ